MVVYSESNVDLMRSYFQGLPERSRRHYAAIEARKLGYGGINYISRILKIDRKTIRKGLRELEGLSESIMVGRQRKEGGGRKKNGSRE